MSKQLSLSFANTQQLLAAKKWIDDFLDNAVYHGVVADIKEATKIANAYLYEIAERDGISLWDLCYQVAPDIQRVMRKDENGDFSFGLIVNFIPLKLEFEKGPDYWEAKYNQLKEKMQAIIDGKEEDHEQER